MSALVPPPGRNVRQSAIEHAKNVFDVGGYVWSGPVTDFLALSRSEQGQVINRLPLMADPARAAIVHDAHQSGWLWIVSESPMYTMRSGRPRQQRPDLKNGWPSAADRTTLALYAANHPLVTDAGLPVRRWFLRAGASASQNPWMHG